jgi:sugar phosphate isomerase/epimerase
VLDASAEHFTEAGNGTIAWRPLLTLAQKLGIEHYFVEQDETDKSPMDSLKISYMFLRKELS